MSTPATGVPLLIKLDGRRVVGIGAGPIAAAKLLPLLAQGADITVIAPVADDPLRAAAREGLVDWQQRPYQDGDLADAVLAVAATDVAEVNAAVAKEAQRLNIPCVRADGGGSADFMADVRRGPLTLAVSTGGNAPAVAARIREQWETEFGDEWGALLTLLGELRQDPEIRQHLADLTASERRLKWRLILDTNILSLLRSGAAQSAREVALQCLSSSSD